MSMPPAQPGPIARDPTAPARLLDAAAEVGLLVERAHRQLDALERTALRVIDELSRSPAAAGPAAPPAPDDPSGEAR
jgi:hypothetical protein